MFWFNRKKINEYNSHTLESWGDVGKGIVLLQFKDKECFSGRRFDWVTYPSGEPVPEEKANQLRIVWYSVYCGEVNGKRRDQISV